FLRGVSDEIERFSGSGYPVRCIVIDEDEVLDPAVDRKRVDEIAFAIRGLLHLYTDLSIFIAGMKCREVLIPGIRRDRAPQVKALDRPRGRGVRGVVFQPGQDDLLRALREMVRDEMQFAKAEADMHLIAFQLAE